MARRWGATSPLRLAESALRRLREPQFISAKRRLAMPDVATNDEGKR
jgi:hypothetical protein